MRKGFALTLMTVAIALAQVASVNATAPTVNDPGDVIVGDLTNVTNGASSTCIFVFPDAIDLDSIVSDQTPDNQIKWSFLETTGVYEINGVASLAASLSGLDADDPTSPRASSRLDLNDGDPGDPVNGQDSNPRTITIRNVALTPDNNNPVNPGNGIISSQTKTLTLFASDCSTFTARTITVYTAKNTSDSLSGGGKNFVVSEDFTVTGGATWIGGGTAGTFTTSVGASGICMTVPGPGANDGGWISPDRYHDLAANTIYCVRVTLQTDATGDAVPIFFLIVDNVNGFGAQPGGVYSQQSWLLSVDGNANAIDTTPEDFVFWWAPAMVNTAQWNSTAAGGGFDPAADTFNDPRYFFRIIDANPGILTQNDAGTICIAQIEVAAVPRDALQSAKAVVFNPPINTATHAVASEFGTTTQTIDNGTATATMSAGAAGVNGTQLIPFDTNAPDAGTFGPLSLYPAVWNAGALYRSSYTLRAATSVASLPDALQLDMDVTNNEIGTINLTTRDGGGVLSGGAPTLTASTYEVYFSGQDGTVSGTTNANRTRSRFHIFNQPALFGTGGGDALVVEDMAIETLVNPLPNP